MEEVEQEAMTTSHGPSETVHFQKPMALPCFLREHRYPDKLCKQTARAIFIGQRPCRRPLLRFHDDDDDDDDDDRLPPLPPTPREV